MVDQGQADRLVGRHLGPRGRYRLASPLGHGGMGAVYRAEDTRLRREVAIKVLDPSAALLRADLVERFRNEAERVASLRHPNILEVYDFDEEDDGLLFLVMPLIVGGTLRDRLHQAGGRPWAVGDVMPLAQQMLSALDYAHQQGLVHRDVKPANILLEGERAYLADFGIAKVMQGEATGARGLTATGAAIGTLAYMAPEQLAGARQVDGRADLYAFGVVLYELLIGRVPFQGETEWQIMAQIMQAPPPPPRQLNPALSEAIQAELVRALAKQPEGRPATGAAFLAAITATSKPTVERENIVSRRGWSRAELGTDATEAAIGDARTQGEEHVAGHPDGSTGTRGSEETKVPPVRPLGTDVAPAAIAGGLGLLVLVLVVVSWAGGGTTILVLMIASVVIGAIAGGIASRIIPGRAPGGLLGAIEIGIGFGILGTWLTLLLRDIWDFALRPQALLGPPIVSLAGSVVTLYAIRVVTPGASTRRDGPAPSADTPPVLSRGRLALALAGLAVLALLAVAVWRSGQSNIPAALATPTALPRATAAGPRLTPTATREVIQNIR